METKLSKKFVFVGIMILAFLVQGITGQNIKENNEIDRKVRKFLESNKYSWRDMNVPESDGKLLYDIIIKNNYKTALEIGTSTGHSGIWIAWALSKTGGKLITIEIDEKRHNEALANFKEVGLSDYIDARLADAHVLVKKIKGPFDFVFCDADKGWYKNYLIDILPEIKSGGCFTAHNVAGTRQRGIGDMLDYLETLDNMETKIDRSSRSGISISYKK
ncbi:O-methyltransferase [Bacteroidota bacterium]